MTFSPVQYYIYTKSSDRQACTNCVDADEHCILSGSQLFATLVGVFNVLHAGKNFLADDKYVSYSPIKKALAFHANCLL